MKRNLLALVVGMLGQGLFLNVAYAGVITFLPDRAIVAGNGCPEGSTIVSVDEFGDLSVEHSELAIILPANGRDRALAARKACVVRVPVIVPTGFYVKSIEQHIIHGAIKSADAELKIASRAAFSSDNIQPFTITLPRGEEFSEAFVIDSRIDHLNEATQRQHYCQDGRAEEQMFQLNVAISGQRDSIHDDLISAAYGSRFGEGIEIEIEPCSDSDDIRPIEN